jgi:hypothetical protein
MKKASEYIKNLIESIRSRERLAVIICVPVAIIAIVIGVGAFSSSDKPAEPLPSDTSDTFGNSLETEQQTFSPSSPNSLEFQSLGDGTCLVMGIGSFRGSELEIPRKSPMGDLVIGIGNRAFEGYGKLVSVSIPESVVSIGNSAFRGCSSLVLISVDRNNPQYCSLNSMLFSKDKTHLICCPAARIGENLLLNPNVRVIEPYAFDGIKNLSRILYEKSPADFQKINIGEGNESFSSLPITCNYYPTK